MPTASYPQRPAPTPRQPPSRRFPPEVLSPEEVAAMLAACGESPTGQRNQALITVLYRAGLRINEALHLRPKDLDPPNGSIRVLYGKGGTSRTVGMDNRAFEFVGRWMALRAAAGINGRDPVFCKLDGRPLRTNYIRVLLPRIAQAAGIAKRVHAHGLRHTHAAELRGEGIDIGVISKQLGHQCISTTARYLDHIAPYAVIETIRARRWEAA